MKNVVVAFMVAIFIGGCGIKSISSDGVGIAISNEQLNSKFEGFPMEQNFVFANVKIEQPRVYIKKGEDKITALMQVSLSAILIPQTKGEFIISGRPEYKASANAIYLKDISVEKLEFKDFPLTNEMTKNIITNLEPLVSEVFNNVPVYKLEKSYYGMLLKDIKIEHSELIVLFGL